jgi:hypothetical protein
MQNIICIGRQYGSGGREIGEKLQHDAIRQPLQHRRMCQSDYRLFKRKGDS